jgi:hypothetical protein
MEQAQAAVLAAQATPLKWDAEVPLAETATEPPTGQRALERRMRSMLGIHRDRKIGQGLEREARAWQLIA